MFNKKIIVLLSFIGILTTSLYAKQQDPDMVSYKDFVEKKDKHPSKNNIQKKANNSMKKVASIVGNLKGQIADFSFLETGTMINTNKYEKQTFIESKIKFIEYQEKQEKFWIFLINRLN